MNTTIEFPPIILMELNPAWKKVAHEGVPKNFPAKRVIPVSTGKSSIAGIYLIKSGRVRLSNIYENGQERVMLYFGKGTLFNENPTLTGSKDCLFTSMETTETIFFSKEQMDRYSLQRPDLLLDLVKSLSAKIQNLYTLLCDLSTYGTFQSVCRIICRLNIHNVQNGIITPRLTQQEFAAMLGVHRSSLHKALARLKKEGIIGGYNRNVIKIYQLDKLCAYAEGKLK